MDHLSKFNNINDTFRSDIVNFINKEIEHKNWIKNMEARGTIPTSVNREKADNKIFADNPVDSPKFKKVVGIAMIKKVFCKTSLKFKIKLEEKLVSGEICNLPIN